MARPKKTNNKIGGKRNKFIDMQDILFQTLDRLNDDENIKENPDVEIKRCNAIAKVSSTVINSVKTNIAIIQLADKHEQSVDSLNDTLGLSIKEQ